MNGGVIVELSFTMANRGSAEDSGSGSGSSQRRTLDAGPRNSTPQHPFYTLPAELIFDIVDLLPPDSFINLAFANYPLLLTHGLAPALSHPRMTYITNQTHISALFPLLRVPAEITLHIMRHLKPIDIMRFVVANYQDLARQGIAPTLTSETVQQLQCAMQADLAPG